MQYRSPSYGAIAITALLGCSFMIPAQAEDHVMANGRYTDVRIGATDRQTDLLRSLVEVTLPEAIATVGQAVEHVLHPYGFRLVVEAPDTAEQYLLFELPLPTPHRALGPMTLGDALTVLGGESFSVEVNPVTRTVRYCLKDSYHQYVNRDEVEAAKQRWLARAAIDPVGTPEPEAVTVVGYGPVQPGDTLSHIAEYLRPDNLTLDQVVVALFLHNPDAFAHDNMNHLLVGTMIQAPRFETTGMSPHEASQFVDEQYQVWLDQRITP